MKWAAERPTRGTGGGKKFLRGCIQLPIFAALIFLSAVVCSAEGPRTLALVDFAVRASGTRGAELSWLGPAVSELLQAKLQLFGGARVLERQRVRTQVRDAKADAGVALDDPTALVGRVPAEVLIAGSVSVDPIDPRRIRIQVRAFEVETAKIVSEAAFSGTVDLAGLLKIAEDLAQALADGLKLSYTPEQLAYAEPAKIDTLRLYIDGDEHLGALRYREAIASFQKALEGNDGRYYAAAHRLQGEAYQALAQAATGEQERIVREEYLKKFKDDALAASGALFDLGLAYEANALWKEAVATYADYIQAVGQEGETVRWRVSFAETLGISSRGLDESVPIFRAEEDAIHFSAASRWITLDAASGKPLRNVPLCEAVGLTADRDVRHSCQIAGTTPAALIVSWHTFEQPRRTPFWRCGAAALSPAGKVVWMVALDVQQLSMDRCLVQGDRIFLSAGGDLWTLAGADGRILSRVRLPGRPRPTLVDRPDFGVDHGIPNLTGLDLVEARLSTDAGLYDLNGGHRIRGWERASREVPGKGTKFFEKMEWPTGRAGKTYYVEPAGVRLVSAGKEVLFIDRAKLVLAAGGFPPAREGPLLFRRPRGYLIVHPEDWTTTTIYADLESERLPKLLMQDAGSLLLAFRFHPRDLERDPRYIPPTTTMGVSLNLLDAVDGRILRTHFEPGAVDMAFPIGRDVGLISNRSMARLRLAMASSMESRSTAAARIRSAACLLELGDLDRSRQQVAGFEREFPGDPRAEFQRMRIAARQGDVAEASRLALRALASGGMSDREAALCLEAVRRVHPDVVEIIQTPLKTRLEFRSMAAPGVFVAVPHGGPRGKVHLLVDSGSKISAVVPTPEFGELVYDGPRICGPPADGNGPPYRLMTVDLLSRERYSSEEFHGQQVVGGVPGNCDIAMVGGRQLFIFDPRNPAPRGVIDLAESFMLLFADDGVLVFGPQPGYQKTGRRGVVVVVDAHAGKEIGRFDVPTGKERIVSAAADRSSLFLTIQGEDLALLRPEARTWLRVESMPLKEGPMPWSHREEGYKVGNPVLEGDRVSFWMFDRRELFRVSLDRLSGRRISRELAPNSAEVRSWSNDPRTSWRALPRVADPVPDDLRKHREFWAYAPGRRPVEILAQDGARDYRIVGAYFLYWRDRIYESIGGGTILARRFPDADPGRRLTILSPLETHIPGVNND